MTDNASPRLALILTIAVIVWPSLLLLALDVYGIQGWLRECRLWRDPIGTGFLLVLLGVSAGVIAYLAGNIGRCLRLRRNVRNLPLLDDAKTEALRQVLPGLSNVALRIYPCDTPQAFTIGWRRPAIVVSNWLLGNLDEQELTAALAHELGHIRHRDTVLMFWIHSLCPGGFGLEPLRRQIRHVSLLVENRADATGAAITGNPLALASALTKAGRHSSPAPSAPIMSFTGNGNAALLRQRVVRLLGEGETADGFNRGAAWLLAGLLAATSCLIVYSHELPCEGGQCDINTMHHSSADGRSIPLK